MLGLIICLVVAFSFNELRSSAVIRETLSGRVLGFESESLPGQIIEQYLGIPYAQPPVDNLRFERPRDVVTWSELLNATQLPPACPQSGQDNSYIRTHLPGFNEESENCLFLNIYVPKTADASPGLAVLVWIHGGSNEVGMGAMLRGDLLAARAKIIVVNLNYRLDALGFLSFENNEFPGNLGLFDQLMALQWIHRNIQIFGGDPDRVTLAGHSAGALDVGVQMLSPLSKGLFQSAILQSGSAISFWSMITSSWREEYRKCGQKFLSDLNCNFADSKRIKTCLKQKPVYEIQQALYDRVSEFPIRHPVVVDGYLLPEEPVYLLENNRSHVTSVLMGFTKDEGLYLLGHEAYYQVRYGDSLDLEFLHDFLGRQFYALGPRSNVAIIVHEYVDWTDPNSDCLLVRSCAEMFGDRGFSAPLHRTANYLTQHRPNSTFMYTFEFDLKEYNASQCSFWRGVPHGRDIFYLFGIPLVGHEYQSFVEGDKAMSYAFMDIWGSFVKTGKPQYDEAKQPLEAFNTISKPYIRMVNTDSGEVSVEMAYNYKPRKMAFWNRLMLQRENLFEQCTASGFQHIHSNLNKILTLCIFVLFYKT